MQNTEQKSNNDFMIEKLKERPVNKKKLLRRTLTTAMMAVIFGLIAYGFACGNTLISQEDIDHTYLLRWIDSINPILKLFH